MKITQSWKRNTPTTDGYYGLTVTYVYASHRLNEIEEIEKKLPKGMIVADFEKEPLQPVWKSECMNIKVDTVEVVRCKNCKHRDPEDHKCDCGHDIQWQLPRADNWFCADGEEK